MILPLTCYMNKPQGNFSIYFSKEYQKNGPTPSTFYFLFNIILYILYSYNKFNNNMLVSNEYVLKSD